MSNGSGGRIAASHSSTSTSASVSTSRASTAYGVPRIDRVLLPLVVRRRLSVALVSSDGRRRVTGSVHAPVVVADAPVRPPVVDATPPAESNERRAHGPGVHVRPGCEFAPRERLVGPSSRRGAVDGCRARTESPTRGSFPFVFAVPGRERVPNVDTYVSPSHVHTSTNNGPRV
jgi:hypothetical protein